MSPRNFSILLLATVASVGLAGWAVVERQVPAASRTVDEPLFAGFDQRLGDVAAVQVRSAGETVTMRKDGDVWRIVERGGYPADPAKLREVARAVAGLQLVEAKTASGDRLPRLELGDPSAEGAKSKLVTFEGADGKPIASVVIGKSKYNLFGGSRGGVYVRRQGEDQAWLAAGEVTLPSDIMGWIDKDVASLPEKDIVRVTLGEGGADPIVISRPQPGTDELVLDRPPETGKVDDEVLARVASTLDNLSMIGVRKADDKPMPADAPRARFETADGIVVTVTSTVEGQGEKEEHWLAMRVSEGQPVVPPAPAPAAAPAADPAAPAPAEAEEAQPAAAASAPAAPAKPLAERVAELGARLEGWQFQVPGYIAERLTYDRQKMLAKPEGTS
ncbi:MAG TPA: DUF4340 domain-containing protein [Geminicoccaceae bacterium]|nr:DUF4340 domain-containing protein [Geminicoccus sp.]HMU48180.1 DUF4340 domain-containing protein [Geminicoccaceae bacterium]